MLKEKILIPKGSHLESELQEHYYVLKDISEQKLKFMLTIFKPLCRSEYPGFDSILPELVKEKIIIKLPATLFFSDLCTDLMNRLQN